MTCEVVTVETATVVYVRDACGSDVVEVQSLRTEIIEVGVVGVQGPPGTPAQDSGLVATATEVIGAERVVAAYAGGITYADSTNPAMVNGNVLGLNMVAVNPGEGMTIRYGGTVDNPGWTWAPDLPIYFNNLGVPTQARPGAGFLQQIGIALSPTKIALNLGVPTTLA